MSTRTKHSQNAATSGNHKPSPILKDGPLTGSSLLGQTGLARLAETGEIDTILMVFPDMQGRWMGKRVTAPYFLDQAADSGVHACAYLLTADMEMEPLPGFNLTSWSQGYQDFHLVPDWTTARVLPWLPKTGLVICDLNTEAGKPIEVAPRQILKRQIERLSGLGLRAKTASELEFYLFKETYETAQAKKFHDLATFGSYIEDYHILQGTKEEPVNRDIRNLMEPAGVPVEFSKGEWGPGQHEINLRYADALEMADRHTVYKHGAKEIAMSKNLCLTFMAKYDSRLAGSSFHLHSSLWDITGKKSKFWEGQSPTKTFRWWLGGQMALAREFALFFAPSVNSYKRYQAGTFAPTRIAWGHDNRTCGFRIVGHGPSYRVENRIPGADANPYLAFAATIAAGIYGIEHKIEPPAETKTNAYESKGVPEVPKSLHEAIAALEKSKVAKQALGEGVIEHYLHAARLELAAFERTVTCWERERYFERI
ncbi:MAG: glutamine synthetase [Elusimicrobia bacterium]|nr:glutamine synthetase [Elusimicrobiota bacterium]